MKHSSNSSNGDENKNKSASNKWTTSSEEELADCVRRIFNKFDFDLVGASDSVGWRRPSFARDVSKTICHTHDSANSCGLCFLGNVVFLPEF